jgi:hypothetical protein
MSFHSGRCPVSNSSGWALCPDRLAAPCAEPLELHDTRLYDNDYNSPDRVAVKGRLHCCVSDPDDAPK